MKNYLIEGSIGPAFIAGEIAKHSSKTEIGAHSIFLGQVRQDELDGKRVVEMDYSAYSSMANKVIDELREKMFTGYKLRCLHVFHSLGKVKAGEISLFVFVSSAHRKDSLAAVEELVNDIKKSVPVWKKEIFDDGSYRWIE